MAGNGLYWAHGEHALRELAEAAGIPVFLNGLARGCLPADHELAFALSRLDSPQMTHVPMGVFRSVDRISPKGFAEAFEIYELRCARGEDDTVHALAVRAYTPAQHHP